MSSRGKDDLLPFLCAQDEDEGGRDLHPDEKTSSRGPFLVRGSAGLGASSHGVFALKA